jgi:Protein of unknown function (DUF2384)
MVDKPTKGKSSTFEENTNTPYSQDNSSGLVAFGQFFEISDQTNPNVVVGRAYPARTLVGQYPGVYTKPIVGNVPALRRSSSSSRVPQQQIVFSANTIPFEKADQSPQYNYAACLTKLRDLFKTEQDVQAWLNSHESGLPKTPMQYMEEGKFEVVERLIGMIEHGIPS